MILVDTSVWIDHLRRPEPELDHRLKRRRILAHPLVIQELSCGHLPPKMLRLLELLPRAPIASHPEMMSFIALHRLAGAGLGAIDAHLLASARLAQCRLWTRDKALLAAAERLHIAA